MHAGTIRNTHCIVDLFVCPRGSSLAKCWENIRVYEPYSCHSSPCISAFGPLCNSSIAAMFTLLGNDKSSVSCFATFYPSLSSSKPFLHCEIFLQIFEEIRDILHAVKTMSSFPWVQSSTACLLGKFRGL